MAWALVGILGGGVIGVGIATAGLSVVLKMLEPAAKTEQPTR